MNNNDHQLKRSLSSRKIQMIALGGAIGVGLFLGSSSSIKWTGPSVVLDYAIAGAVMYMIMRALDEMLYVHPVTGSFADFASQYIHPVFGYLSAWSNIFQWITIGMSEIVAIGVYCNYWWPNLPHWIPCVIAIIFLETINLVSVKSFGLFEYWFSFIKILTIILLIIAGLGMIIFGFGNGMHPIGFSNLWTHGFFAGGFKGMLFAFAIVLASYQGTVEFIGVTAGETRDPKHTIIKATQSLIFRILLFYVGSVFVIVTIYPWNKLNQVGSPFVETFTKLGITVAAGIINFVVLTAAFSGCNSGIYNISRMAYTLSKKHRLPKCFAKLSKSGVTYISVLAVSIGLVIGMILNAVLPMILHNGSKVFVLIYSSSVLPGMIPWVTILISQLKFRKLESPELKRTHPYKMPWSPYSNYVCLGLLALTLIFMALNPDTQIPLLIGIIFLVVMTVRFEIRYKRILRFKHKKQWLKHHQKV